ncbi:MAG: tripartite tricarboxylate transporter TctB family protein [Thermoanaerobacteraceae bacterium]|uniref:tripartite tricarboxylate transporter TctB family protein n=1 Tax=Thermanaeromonas sp. C210 TaxID=2731925 RepID=UPI00155C63ED|nr:tripartite tricarboxylate transporter TctB family protein [Thermanaeromonas sp. C210]MBE3582384.1 tripartite tricarboxylate transporter TctB family protein [Thermoanaerobacteraceae bacterium]GFN21910.1 hypothetical protein TAMC210_02260 [Thermanaeromonas sp. C210]
MAKGAADSLVVAGIGLFFLVYSLQYNLGTLDSPGEGIFPLLVAVAVTAMAGWLLITSLLSKELQQPAATKGEKEGPQGRIITLILVNAAVLWAMKLVGFFTGSFVLVCLCCRLLGVKEWAKAIGIAAGAVLGAYLIFAVWLQVSFPKGLFI